ncbi:MAG: hypothetical protein HYZ81_19305 [Nitrospinae bacterium]|nr:hypothetical protein [Nitrospinota bacterium]
MSQRDTSGGQETDNTVIGTRCSRLESEVKLCGTARNLYDKDRPGIPLRFPSFFLFMEILLAGLLLLHTTANAYHAEPDLNIVNYYYLWLLPGIEGKSTHREITRRAIELIGEFRTLQPQYEQLYRELTETKDFYSGAPQTQVILHGTDFEDFDEIQPGQIAAGNEVGFDIGTLLGFGVTPFYASLEKNLNHGYNPKTEAGWPTIQARNSRCWSQQFDIQNAKDWSDSPYNIYSWSNALKFYRTYQKNPNKTIALKLAYESLGHVAHLLQDVSVPAHVHTVDHGSPWGRVAAVMIPKPQCVNPHEDHYEKYALEHHQEILPSAKAQNIPGVQSIPAFSNLSDAFQRLATITYPVGNKGNPDGWPERYIDGPPFEFGSYLDPAGNPVSGESSWDISSELIQRDRDIM